MNQKIAKKTSVLCAMEGAAKEASQDKSWVSKSKVNTCVTNSANLIIIFQFQDIRLSKLSNKREQEEAIHQFKMKKLQEAVIRNARVKFRDSTAVTDEHFDRIKNDPAKYSLTDCMDMNMHCLKGCKKVNVTLWEKEEYKQFRLSDQSSTLQTLEGSKKSKGGLSAIGFLFKRAEKFSIPKEKLSCKLVTKGKKPSKSNIPKKPAVSSKNLKFPWKKVLLGRKKSKTSKSKSQKAQEIPKDAINPLIVANAKKVMRSMRSVKLLKVKVKTRLRGGAIGDEDEFSLIGKSISTVQESLKTMISIGIANAKSHDINVKPGIPNLALGDCAFETVCDQITSRDCFQERYDEHSPDHWRYVWMSEVQKIAYAQWNEGHSKEEWDESWEKLKQPQAYEHQLGDLVLPGIAHSTHKYILIFNTSPVAGKPIYVVPPTIFEGGYANTNIPVCLLYNQYHYESVIPVSQSDVQKTMDLAQSWMNNSYNKTNDDIPALVALLKQNELS